MRQDSRLAGAHLGRPLRKIRAKQAPSETTQAYVFANQQQGGGGGANHVLCHAADQQALKAAPAVGAHHDQVGIPLAGRIDDHVRQALFV